MKNTKKMWSTLAIIAIVAVIGFSTASCGDDSDGGGGLGNTIVSGAEVIYDSSNIENLDKAKSVTDFSFIFYGFEEKGKPLSIYLDGSPKATVNNNKVTIILGTPKSAYLQDINDIFYFEEIDGITVTPSDAKLFKIWDFFNSDGDVNYYEDYTLYLEKDDKWAGLIYADRNVTIKGTDTYESHGTTYTDTFNVSLKKGWNYMIGSYMETDNTGTYTSSTTQPSGCKWTICDIWHHYH